LVSPPREPDQDGRDYVFLVDLIKEYLGSLFPGLSVLHACSFRVTRDSNLDLDEEADTDLVQALEHELNERRRGEPVRLEVSRGAHPDIVNRFLQAFDLEPDDHLENRRMLDRRGDHMASAPSLD